MLEFSEVVAKVSGSTVVGAPVKEEIYLFSVCSRGGFLLCRYLLLCESKQ